MLDRILSKFNTCLKRDIVEEQSQNRLKMRKEFIYEILDKKFGPNNEKYFTNENEEYKLKRWSDENMNEKDENYCEFLKNSKIPGIVDSITDFTDLSDKHISRVYYTNSIIGGHARVILELKNKIHISFSYGQTGGKTCFLEEGILYIEIFKHFPDSRPGIREIEIVDIKDPKLTVGKSIGIAKLIFDNGQFIKFNYWRKNCYVFADKLYNEITGDNLSKLDWFINECSKGNKWVGDPSRLEKVYGMCPYK